MCYSKEVQLITESIILLSCLFYYIYFSKIFSGYKKQWLNPFLNNVILVFLCIGFHQFFEFLSLVTNSQVIYKLGLIISISSMYFVLRSLEVLTNRNFHSKISLFIILAAALYNIFIPMSFASFSFYVRHYSGFVWASLWMLLFIYWHICSIISANSLKDSSSKKAILYYMMCIADISFILSLIYILFGYFTYSVNVCYDSPSIWCTFFVIQSFFIPFFLSSLPAIFKRPKILVSDTIRKTVFLLLISAAILIVLILTFPFFGCLTWKFVFP